MAVAVTVVVPVADPVPVTRPETVLVSVPLNALVTVAVTALLAVPSRNCVVVVVMVRPSPFDHETLETVAVLLVVTVPVKTWVCVVESSVDKVPVLVAVVDDVAVRV